MEMTDEKRKKLIEIQKEIESIMAYTDNEYEDLQIMYELIENKHYSKAYLKREQKKHIENLKLQAKELLK